MTLDTPLTSLPIIKKPLLTKLTHLGIETVSDLLYHFPSRYEDYSATLPIKEATPGLQATFAGVLTQFSVERSFRKRMLITHATLTDDTGSIRLIWFNQKFVSQVLAQGMDIRVSGKVTEDKHGFILSSPAFERATRDATHTARLVPVYPETRGVTSKYLRYLITLIFKKITTIEDPLPRTTLEKLNLPSLHRALVDIHFPKNTEATLIAQKRFAFDEMFFLQLKALEVRALYQGARALPVELPERETARFIETFPFKLTRAQSAATESILSDLTLNRPMNRLLNGDVGSGKTAVAAIALHAVATSGSQAVLLAPTETLARQHFESLSTLFANTHLSLALYTRSYQILDGDKVSKKTLLSALKAGIPSIIIGTHALLEDTVTFHSLTLVIVDEQHRFGVSQRAHLQETTAQTSTDVTQTHTDKASPLLYEELTYKIRGAVFNVKKQLGLGHKETIYQKAIAEELEKINVSFNQEKSIDIKYDDKKIGVYRPDFIIENKIILELKALPSVGKFEKQQVWHYLKGSDYTLALLINFGREDIHIERFIHTGQHQSASRPQKSVPLMPHFLTMTATPIPRTLALAFFGNLDISLLNEMPKNRKPIITRIAATEEARAKVYAFIRQEIKKGRQAFIIFPLVETSLALKDVKAAVAEHKHLEEEIFPDLRIGLLHGKLKAEEKEVIMRDFKEKRSDILVATSVVEVGIDVPNATIILIEEAERFGLSQLHQFRGRVGRGEHQSYCFLMPHDTITSKNARLEALEKSTSGFDIAEADLALRGPGSFFGTRQSGLPDIAMENLTNMKLITLARQEAEALLATDPTLTKHPFLRHALTRFSDRVHME